MVKRLSKYLALLLLVTLLGLGGFAGWLLGTNSGARWLLGAVSRYTPVTIVADEVHGYLAGDLALKALQVRFAQGQVGLQRLRLVWHPARLWRGELRVAEFSAADGEVILIPSDEPAPPRREPLEFAWPKLTGRLTQVLAGIETLRLERISIGSQGQEPFVIEDLAAAIEWKDGALRVDELSLKTPGWRGDGKVAAGFVEPLFDARLQLFLTEPLARVDDLRLLARLEPRRAPAQAGGPLEFRAALQSEQKLEVLADLTLGKNYLQLDRLSARRPGQSGTLIGTGAMHLVKGVPQLKLDLQVAALDLEAETGTRTALDAKLAVQGTPDQYQGSFSVTNAIAGVQGGSLSGNLAGSLKDISLSNLDGRWLSGTLEGGLQVGWAEGLRLNTELRGRNFDPRILHPQLPGRINLDVQGEFSKSPGEQALAALNARLLDSRLQGRGLHGQTDLLLRGQDLQVNSLDLRGAGFAISGAGRLSERLGLNVDITDLGGLLPQNQGRVKAKGWLRWAAGHLNGALEAEGGPLLIAGNRIGTLDVRARHLQPQAPIEIDARVEGFARGETRFDSAHLQFAGQPAEHAGDLSLAWPGGSSSASIAGGYREAAWQGTLSELQAEDSRFGSWRLDDPVDLGVSAKTVKASTLSLSSDRGERIALASDLGLQPLSGNIEASWKQLDLSKANPWLGGERLSGGSSGEVSVQFLEAKRLDVEARVGASAQFIQGEAVLEVADANLELDWDGQGLRAEGLIPLAKGGEIKARLNSAEPGRLGAPESGELELLWEDLELTRLRPWLPAAMEMSGALSGGLAGRWLPGWGLDIEGRSQVSEGVIEWDDEDLGMISVALRQAEVLVGWRGQTLDGNLNLDLEDYGFLRGNVQFPIEAKFPLVVNRGRPISGQLTGKVQEKGLLTALLPGLVQETKGELDLALQAGGTLGQPRLAGSLALAGAGAYLPAAGIELQDVGLKVNLGDQEVRLESMQLTSGGGRLEGSGSLRLIDWKPADYRATLVGRGVQLVNLPELELKASPDLKIEGTPQRMVVRGDVLIPDMLVGQRKAPTPVRSSPDLIIVDAPEKEAVKELPMELDVAVRVKLGDHALVKTAGVDARLGGDLKLRVTGVDDITAQGEVRVEQGSYAAYGVKLDIERGKVLFAGGPVDRPTLDVLALRTAGEVKAGVKVTGTPRTPKVQLYSDPSMPDTDKLAYIVLGHPLGSGGGQSDLLMVAAGALLSKGESAVLQDQVKRRLGLDVIQIEAGNGDVEASVVTIGKYLNPKLYVSLGHALFTNTNEVRLRYSITDRWQAESNVGVESGADLFYKIEFW